MGDNRRLDRDDGSETPILDYWHEEIGDLQAMDCLEAVRMHRQASTEYLMPAHIRAAVKRIREARLDAEGASLEALTADMDGDTPGAVWAATLRARRAAVAAGNPPAEVLALVRPASLAAITDGSEAR